MRVITLFFILFSALLLSACANGKDTLDPASPPSADRQQPAQVQNTQVEIAVGTPAAKVTQLLGAPDSTEKDSKGREIWIYESKRAEFLYVSNTGNTQTLVIGGYVSGSGPSNALPLTLRLTYDNSRKVIDFVFNQMTF